MNYKKIALAAICMASLPVIAQKPCKIQGEVLKGAAAEKVYIYVEGENGFPETPDSIDLKKGKFQYTSNYAEPHQVYFIAKMADGNQMSMPTFLVPGENGKLTFSGNEYFLNGSKFYKEWNNADMAYSTPTKRLMAVSDSIGNLLDAMSEEERKEKMAGLIAEYRKANDDCKAATTEYFKSHCGEEGCVMFALLQGNMPITTMMEEVGDKLKDSPFAPYLAKRLQSYKAQQEAKEKEEAIAKASQEATGEGQMFTDFEAEYNGKIQKLSDYVGKGKYVLVDFWASWCGPCKAEIPNLIEAYNKYKGDKFEVLGVATWDKPKDTEKAITDMQIPYPQIMNAQKAGSDAYGILGIPQIILFGPDGTIVKRNLRGAAIEETLKSLLDK